MKRYVITIYCCLFYMVGPYLFAHESSNEILDSLYLEIRQELYNNPQRIIHLYKQASTYYVNNPQDKAKFYYVYATALRMKGDYDGCITTLYDAIQLLHKDETSLMRGEIFDLMSKCYCVLNDFQTAMKLNEKATNIFRIYNDSVHLASAYNSRGIIHAYQLEYDLADLYLKKALAINRKERQIKEVAANLNNLCIYKGNLKEKMGYLNEAIIINRNLGAQWSIAENLNNMGKQYYYAGQYDKALHALKEAYDIALSIDAKGLICDNYEYSALIYKALGNYMTAYEMQEALLGLSQEIQSVNKLWSIERNVNQRQLTETEHQAQLQEQKYQTRLLNSYLISAIIAGALLYVITTVILQRKQRQKKMELMKAQIHITQSDHEIAKLKLKQQEMEMKSIQQELENSQKETTDVAVFMQSRNELLDKIYEQIKTCYKMDSAEVIPYLKRINAFIKQNQLTDKANSTILQTIDRKSEEFIERLTMKHPNLTQGERHLASLLRVDISTKDIAILTGLNPKSINMNRYRLRKSLGLDSETDLSTYLKSI